MGRLSAPRTAAPVWRSRGETLAEALGVHVTLGGAGVLRGVSLSVVAGEVTAVVGPNGAGKSTLLGAFAGDIVPERGSASIQGRPAADWPVAELALMRTLLPQNPVVSFGFSVEAVVRMARTPWERTFDSARDDEIVARAMADTAVIDFAARRFLSLSGGEKARASLARVLAQQTQILLLDEPTAALDVHHTETAFEAIRKRAAQGSGVVVVLHDLQLAAAHADRVVLLSGGAIAAQGPPCEVLIPGNLSRVYGHEIDVVQHPETGLPLAVPKRGRGARTSDPRQKAKEEQA